MDVIINSLGFGFVVPIGIVEDNNNFYYIITENLKERFSVKINKKTAYMIDYPRIENCKY